MIHEQAHCHNEAANHQLHTAEAFWIIRIFSIEECSSLMQNLMRIHCSTQSFWMWWPHSTHAHSTASTDPHWLVQWSHHCSHIGIPVHSPWLLGYINVMQTILVILTMVGLFPDWPLILQITLLSGCKTYLTSFLSHPIITLSPGSQGFFVHMFCTNACQMQKGPYLTNCFPYINNFKYES